MAVTFALSLCTLKAKEEDTLILEPATTEIFVATPEEAAAMEAGKLLQAWLRKAARSESGFELRLSAPAADADKQAVGIVLNDPTLELPADLAADGFALRTGPSRISIRGKAGDAVLFGAVELLRLLGVHFYLPTDLFTVLPEQGPLRMPPTDLTSSPFTRSLFFSGISWNEAARWARLNAANRRKGGTHQHNSYDIFPPEKFAERFPDIYPIHDGQRYVPPNAKDQSWQPNFLSPHIVDAAMESVSEYFAKHPQHEYIAVSIQDGRGFCQGPETTAIVDKFRAEGLDHPLDRAHSSIYWNQFIRPLAERMRKEYPDKLLVALAYAGTRFPPAQSLPENVVVFTNFHVAEYLGYEQQVAEVEQQGGKATDIELGPDRWLSLVDHYGNHDWYQGSGYLMPRSYSGNWHRYLQRVKGGALDAFMHVETYPGWGFDGHKYYLLSRLLWNPMLEPEQLTSKMCQDLFGPAGQQMEAYFGILETLWNQLNIIEGPERKLASWDRAYTTSEKSREMIASARSHLDQAKELAKTPEQKARIELFSDCFSIAEMMFAMAAWTEFDAEQVAQFDSAAKEIVERHGHMALMHPKSLEGIRFLGAHVRRALAPEFAPSQIADREALIPIGDPLWETLPQVPFTMQDGEQDPQQTTMRLARDASNLYVLVEAPRIRQREMIIDERTTWRSDNIEFKFDTDGNWGTLEAQFWVKPNGMLVDYIGREVQVQSVLTSETRLDEKTWALSVRIPLQYLGFKAGDPKPFGMQVFRNEFKEIPGFNQTDFVSIWAGRIAL